MFIRSNSQQNTAGGLRRILQGYHGNDIIAVTSGAADADVVMGPTGPTGPRGVPGAVGPRGVTGSAGMMGATGVRGATGATGATGAVGAMGATGATGATGPAGARGPTGAAGEMPKLVMGSVTSTGPDGMPSATIDFVDGQYVLNLVLRDGAVGTRGLADPGSATGAIEETSETGVTDKSPSSMTLNADMTTHSKAQGRNVRASAKHAKTAVHAGGEAGDVTQRPAEAAIQVAHATIPKAAKTAARSVEDGVKNAAKDNATEKGA